MSKRTTRTGSKAGSRKAASAAFKIHLRGKDNAPLTMAELREGLIEAARELLRYERDCRSRTATLYVSMVDENGEPVRIDNKNEITIYPYRSAADEHRL